MKSCHLQLPIINLVTTEYPTVGIEAGTVEALRLFDLHGCAALPVVEGEVLKGLLFHRDIWRNDQSPRDTPCRRWVCKNVVYLSPEDSVQDAVSIFKDGGFDAIPVVWAGGYFAGMLLREVVAEYVPFAF